MPPRKDTAEAGGKPEGSADTVTGDGSGEALPPVEETGDQEQTGGAETEHRTAIDAMFDAADQLQVDTGSLVYDVRDFMLEQIKQRPKPWSATSQGEQRDVAAACEHNANELVRKVVEAIASKGVDAIRVLLTKVNAGGDDIVITGKVKFLDADPTERDKSILNLHHAIGRHVMLTRASAEDYQGEGAGVDELTQPDEPGFGFEAGDDGGDE